MNFIKTPTKGMRDILPNEMEIREYVIGMICETYSKFGFKRIETPCVEHIENLSNKQGGDNEKLIFKVLKRGEKLKLEEAQNIDDLVDSGLRYDLTVPLARYYANNMNELDKPFKALQIGSVWRADRPQKGRFRQFIQCDIDILGDKTNLAEIELILATTTLLKKVGLKEFKVKINDRRILKTIAISSGFNESDCESIFISLDKLDKIGIDGVKNELLENGYTLEVVEKYLSLFNNKVNTATNFYGLLNNSEIDLEVATNLDNVVEIIKEENNINIEFDPTLVRGMSYYTGMIFEIEAADYGCSIAGGGRYDEMIEKYSNVSVPACGFSIGFERLINILMENNYQIPNTTDKYALIIDKDVDIKEYINKATELRNNGYIVNVQYKSKNFKYQKEMLEAQGYEIILNGEKI